ncbi:uncharacterized protein K441DRAFT_549610 [Cenococcum geophilum 1.58]|uniref:uncharacterized protein n=1 Tax=Cenococcum geophilum 1.58 TaxID=794803 RepID=UPI00358F30AF|nr:hypothetical protein K441DRAFT_549610 [Cenococcum geophilum 1.58]
MAHNDPNGLRRNSSNSGSYGLSPPVTPQPSARTPLQPSGSSNPNYLSISTTDGVSNGSVASFESSAPLLRTQPTASNPGIELIPVTPPVASPPVASPPLSTAPPPAIENEGQPNRIRPSQTSTNLQSQPTPPAAQNLWKEWRSSKIQWRWLSILLCIVISFIAVIAALEVVSRRRSGFVRQGKAPAFLAAHPALEKALWEQGILYTAFPAFIMTIYRTMWESTVMAFADRQPYVDLKKEGGRPPRSTIMLDYKAESFFHGWIAAIQNKHLLLAACMLSSVVLTLFIVPLTSFLFTTSSFTSNTTFPLHFETVFNSNILEKFPNVPDLRLPMNAAAVMRIQDAGRLPWTDGEYAFPKFTPQVNIGEGNATLETTAYSARADCITIPESQYRKTILTPGDTGIPAFFITITADDRGCSISNAIYLAVNSDHTEIILRIWPTVVCSADAGWSRFSIMTGLYMKESGSLTNFSLISCIPSYWVTPGTLVATLDSLSAPLLRSFTPYPSGTSEFRPESLWSFFETGILEPNCVEPASNMDANEFGRYAYRIASKINPVSPLHPEAMASAAQMLFNTTFAVFASTVLFKPASSPLNSTGIYSTDEIRLIVVSPVAYVILGVLGTVALLNIFLFYYARQESILYEEPAGLLSMAGILHKSDVNTMIESIALKADFNGKTTEAVLKKEGKLDEQRYYFEESKKKIVQLIPSQP